MFTKRLTKYDKSRLEDFKTKLHQARQDYISICESMFIHDLSKPNSKKDYPKYEKWLREREDLTNKMRHIIRNYEKIFVKYISLVNVIEEEMNKDVY